MALGDRARRGVRGGRRGGRRRTPTPTTLRRHAERLGVALQPDWTAGEIVLELYEKLVEHTLIQPTFVRDYPVAVRPLARPHRDDPRLAEAWDLIIGGVEIAPAYSELVDPVEQRRRLVEQSLAAAKGDPEAMELDEDFLRALEYGMPPTGGMGLGVDRLLMMLTGKGIRETILFPLAQAALTNSAAVDCESDERLRISGTVRDIAFTHAEGNPHMAQKHIVQLIDDLDQSVAEETVSFALDGTYYEIDLSSKNAAKLRDALAIYVANARRASRSGGSRPAAPGGRRPGRPAATASRPRRSASGPARTVTSRREGPHPGAHPRGLQRQVGAPARPVGTVGRELSCRGVRRRRPRCGPTRRARPPARARRAGRVAARGPARGPKYAVVEERSGPRSGTPSRRARCRAWSARVSSLGRRPAQRDVLPAVAGHDRAGTAQRRLDVAWAPGRSWARRRRSRGSAVTRAKPPPMQKPMIPTLPVQSGRSRQVVTGGVDVGDRLALAGSASRGTCATRHRAAPPSLNRSGSEGEIARAGQPVGLAAHDVVEPEGLVDRRRRRATAQRPSGVAR